MVACIVNPMKEFALLQEELLHRRINIFTAKEKELISLIYQSETESSTRIHTPTETVNGVFDISKHKPEEWAVILDKTTFTHLGIQGKCTHLIFTTSDLWATLAQAFDFIVYLEQEFTGLHVNKLRRGFKWESYSTGGDLAEVSNNVYAIYNPISAYPTANSPS